MRVHVILEAVFQRTHAGAIVTGTPLHFGFFRRYLEAFTEVVVVARVDSAPVAADGWHAVEGPGVTVHALPAYRGLSGYLRHRQSVLRSLRAAVARREATILRAPSPLGGLLGRELEERPYAVEVVGDPWDTFAPGVVAHPLRPLIRWRLTTQLRQQCAHAALAAYVTTHALQARYPCPSGMVGCSDVNLPADAFVDAPRAPPPSGRAPRLALIGSLEQLYKGPDLLLSALARCRARGMAIELDLLGEGRYRPQLEQQAHAWGLAKQVRFLGQVPAGPAVRACLDRCDVFVMPSRTEGLPRALVEAMARGLPCLASRVGGIPELLDPEDLLAAGDLDALTTCLIQRLADDVWMVRAARRNLARARDYAGTILDTRRTAFYRAVRDASGVST